MKKFKTFQSRDPSCILKQLVSQDTSYYTLHSRKHSSDNLRQVTSGYCICYCHGMHPLRQFKLHRTVSRHD